MSTNCGRVTATGLPSNTSVTVCSKGTTTPVDLFETRTGTTAVTNPVTTDTFGHLSFFAAAEQTVDVVYVPPESDVRARFTVTVWPDPHNAWPG